MCSALCRERNSSTETGSGVYGREGEKGKCCGSKVCTWQSQASSGTAKFTGVDGCEALARITLGLHARAAVPAVTAPSIISRRVNMGNPPGDLPREYNANFRALSQGESCGDNSENLGGRGFSPDVQGRVFVGFSP